VALAWLRLLREHDPDERVRIAPTLGQAKAAEGPEVFAHAQRLNQRTTGFNGVYNDIGVRPVKLGHAHDPNKRKGVFIEPALDFVAGLAGLAIEELTEGGNNRRVLVFSNLNAQLRAHERRRARSVQRHYRIEAKRLALALPGRVSEHQTPRLRTFGDTK